jgi:hypothetical protein
MPPNTQLRALRYALIVVGLAFIFTVYPFTRVWPSGWRWDPDNEMYLQMIMGIYATLGVFLLLAARDPARHLSLIWFTVWSSVVHGAIMAAQAIVYPMHRGHLLGDVPALFIIAIVLGSLTPRAKKVSGAISSPVSAPSASA